MAAVIGYVQGFNKDGSPKAGRESRLGHRSVQVWAQTYETFLEAEVDRDGRVWVLVRRGNGEVLLRWECGPEHVQKHQYTAETCPGQPCGDGCDHVGEK